MQQTTANSVKIVELSERDGVAEICQQVAKEIRNTLLSDMKSLTDDLRQQYRDHNKLLAQQELVVQQLVRQTQTISDRNLRKVSTPTRNGISKDPQWRIGNALCTETEATGSEDVLENYYVTPTHSNERVMSPRPSSAPPLPNPNPHPSPENTYDDVLNPISEEDDRSRSAGNVKFSTAHDITPCLGDKDPDVGNLDWKPSSVSFDQYTKAEADGASRTSLERRKKGSVSSEDRSRASEARQEQPVGRGSVRARGGDMFGQGVPGERLKLDEDAYNVCNFYWDTGICQKIARSELFANITLAVIGANAIYIGIDADNNNEENLLKAETVFFVCENLFCAFFSFEWMMRFCSFQRKRDSLKDKWFVFDSCLVTMMVIETWMLPFLFSGGTGIPTGGAKMLRLLRLARMARVMRAFPDLMAMIKGVGVASRAVGSALLMLILLVYVFSIMMFTLLKDEKNVQIEERFNRLGLVMWTLLIDGAFMDGIGYISRAMIEEGQYMAIIVLLVFVLSSALTVMNMLIGVLCQVVSAVAATEKEDHAIRTVKSELLSMLKEMDEDNSGLISKDEMSAVLNNQSALGTLETLNVDIEVLMDQLEMKFEVLGELTIHAIMDLILMLRGDRPPTIKDMLESLAFNRWKINKSLPVLPDLEELRGSLMRESMINRSESSK